MSVTELRAMRDSAFQLLHIAQEAAQETEVNSTKLRELVSALRTHHKKLNQLLKESESYDGRT